MSTSEQNGRTACKAGSPDDRVTGDRTASQEPRIVLGCAMLKPQQSFINALLPIIKENIFEGYVFPSVSLLPHARNIICKIAYDEHPDFTHLLMIDDDMTFTLSDILKLYKADKDVISGVAVTRKPPYKIVASLDPDKFHEYVTNETIVNVAHVGMAFTLIKRHVLDTIRQDHDIWFTMDREPRLTFNDEWVDYRKTCTVDEAMHFGQDAHLNSKLPGEDIAFSYLCEKLEIVMHVHCGVLVGHVGEKTYDITDSVSPRSGDKDVEGLPLRGNPSTPSVIVP